MVHNCLWKKFKNLCLVIEQFKGKELERAKLTQIKEKLGMVLSLTAPKEMRKETMNVTTEGNPAHFLLEKLLWETLLGIR